MEPDGWEPPSSLASGKSASPKTWAAAKSPPARLWRGIPGGVAVVACLRWDRRVSLTVGVGWPNTSIFIPSESLDFCLWERMRQAQRTPLFQGNPFRRGQFNVTKTSPRSSLVESHFALAWKFDRNSRQAPTKNNLPRVSMTLKNGVIS